MNDDASFRFEIVIKYQALKEIISVSKSSADFLVSDIEFFHFSIHGGWNFFTSANLRRSDFGVVSSRHFGKSNCLNLNRLHRHQVINTLRLRQRPSSKKVQFNHHYAISFSRNA